MPHHGNEEEHGASRDPREENRDENQKPVIHDNRKVDPKTGQARHPDQERRRRGAGFRGRTVPGRGHPQQRGRAGRGIRGAGRQAPGKRRN